MRNMSLLFFFIVNLLLQNIYAQELNSVGLLKPIKLDTGWNKILLDQYFENVNLISGVHADSTLDVEFIADPGQLLINSKTHQGPYGTIEFNYKGDAICWIFIHPIKQSITLSLNNNNYTSVVIKGQMNAWKSQELTLENGQWSYHTMLNPGRYQYLFVADGKEMLDPLNLKTAPNGSGGVNSLFEVETSKEKIQLIPSKTSDQKIYINTSQIAGQSIVLWNNKKLPYWQSGKHIVCRIPDEAKLLGRSFVRLYSSIGFNQSNDVLIPLQHGEVINNAASLNRTDWESQIMYFTLVDRFSNGNPSNDRPVVDTHLIAKTNFQGGDLKGIRDKIESGYFNRLGINTIWLSPISQNPDQAFQEYVNPRRWYSGYHGYWPIQSCVIDSRFGTDQELNELISLAHHNGINVLLDFVTNHVHQDHPMYKQRPDLFTSFILPNGQKNIRIWDDQRLTTWFDDFLPTIDLSKPEAIAMQSDSAMYWLHTFPFDGFRHDATKHVPTEYWLALTRKIKNEFISKGRSIYQIGETYGSNELIASYIGNSLLDSQFDFNLYFDLRSLLLDEQSSFASFVPIINQSFTYFGHHSTMGNITGNHDQVRYISLANKDVSLSESGVEAGFNRTIGTPDTMAYNKLSLLTAIQFSLPGVPVFLYGDEIGLPGAGDPDNRKMMKFDSLSYNELNTLQRAQQLGNIRKNCMALIYGETEIIKAEKEYFVLKRSYFGETVYCVFNKSNRPMTIELDVANSKNATGLISKNVYPMQNTKTQIQLAPNGYEYLKVE